MAKIAQCYITRLLFSARVKQHQRSNVVLISFDHQHDVKTTLVWTFSVPALFKWFTLHTNVAFRWPKAVRRGKDEEAEESSPLQVFHGERRGPPLCPREPRGTRPPDTPSAALSASCSSCCSSMGWPWSHLQKCEPPWIQTYGHNVTVNVNNRWVDSMATKFTETPVAS